MYLYLDINLYLFTHSPKLWCRWTQEFMLQARRKILVSLECPLTIARYRLTIIITHIGFCPWCILMNSQELDTGRKWASSTCAVPWIQVSNCTLLYFFVLAHSVFGCSWKWVGHAGIISSLSNLSGFQYGDTNTTLICFCFSWSKWRIFVYSSITCLDRNYCTYLC